jgi:type I restriction enzyme S subunit
MATLQPYKKYIPVVYDYATELPDGWQLLPNIAIFKERIERGQNNEEQLLSVTVRSGIIRQEDVEIKKDTTPDDKSRYKLIEVGDIAFNPMNMWFGACGYSKYRGITSPVYTILKPKIDLNPIFFHYLFRTKFYQNYSKRFSYGIMDERLSLRYLHFKHMYSIVPPLEVQNTIVAYLDKKNEQIDTFIRNKEKLIELLEANKKTVVKDAITKGINQNAVFTKYDIDWLDKIPSHWELKKVRYIGKLYTGSTPNSGNEKFWDGDIIWITPEDLSEKGLFYISNSKRKITKLGLKEIGKRLVPANSIILTTRAPIGNIAIIKTPSSFNQGCKAVEVNSKRHFCEFIYYSLLTGVNELQTLGNGTTFTELSSGALKNFKLPCPPINEQIEIAEYIKIELNKIDGVINRTLKEISAIKEYREALIADLIMGKKSIPNLQTN